MAYPAAAVANAFLDLARDHGQELSPMKLQKLVYYAHGWYLGLVGKPLIDENVEAWEFGPVIPSLYHELKIYGNQRVPGPVVVARDQYSRIDFDAPRIPPADKTAHAVIERVWQQYSPFSAIALSRLTHADGSPWDTVWKPLGKATRKGTDIPDETIRDYFVARMADQRPGV